MTRVVFVLQEPTPYRTPHLQAFAGRDDLDVTIVYAAKTVQRRDWSVPEASERIVYLDGPSLPATRVLQHDYALTPQVWPLLTRLRPDVVVVGGWSLMATQLAIAWARTHRVPYVLMSDNHLLEPRPAWVRAVKSAVLRFVVPQASGWLVPGSLGRDHVVHYGARPDQVVRFPLTIDVDDTARRTDAVRERRAELRERLSVPDGAVAVLHVGRLVPQKAVDVLIRAVAQARDTAPALHLVVVGSGPEEASLRALAGGLELPATFTGFLSEDDLLEAYVAADVFALLSHRETWGVAVTEAATCALPLVLSRNVGAAADLLEPGVNGILVEAGDVEAAADAFAALAADPGLRARYGARSRELVRPWGYDESVEALANLVAEVSA
jgi:glycosyltransferase involved in cell wall biosynthesis